MSEEQFNSINQRFDSINQRFDHVGEQFRHLTSLVENLGMQIKVVAEGYLMTNERIDRLEVTLDKRFNEVDAKLAIHAAHVDKRFDTLEAAQADTNQRVVRLEATTEETSQRVERVETWADETGPQLAHLAAVTGDSRQRLKRIEGHLAIKSPRSTRSPAKATRTPPGKRSKKS